MIIAFSGMDGSGKSLQAKALSETLRSSDFSCRYVWSRWSPFLAKPVIVLGRFILGSSGSSEDEQYRAFSMGKRRLFRRGWLAQAWKTVAMLDYLFQVLIKVVRHGRRRRIIVCDRYLVDLLVDLANNFGYDPKEAAGLCHSWLLTLFPRPDLYFLLDLPAEVAFARKDDVTVSYLQDRRALYLGLAEFYGADILDGDVTIEQLKKSIQDKTLAFLEGGGTGDRRPSSDHRD